MREARDRDPNQTQGRHRNVVRCDSAGTVKTAALGGERERPCLSLSLSGGKGEDVDTGPLSRH